jgi:hypothetical protein
VHPFKKCLATNLGKDSGTVAFYAGSMIIFCPVLSTKVYTPILVWQPMGKGEEDPANDLAFLDGRHTVNSLVMNFDDAPITILVPRQEYRQIAALLDESSAESRTVVTDGTD